MSHKGYKSINPATGELNEEFDLHTHAEVEQILAEAQTAYEKWRALPIEDRAPVVAKIAELLSERADDLAVLVSQDMGKSTREAKGEILYSSSIFKYYATEGPALAADQPIKDVSGAEAMIQKRPIGVLLGIMPWNFPVYQVARFAAPNFMLGNTIVLKHAESCPRVALALVQLFADAGLPTGVYNNVFADHDQIAEIIADKRVQGVSLTGSERAGAAVAETAGKNLKKVVLELGGSDPYVVLKSDDVAASAKAAFRTRLANTGQTCTSNKRMIVMSEIYDDFVAELKNLTGTVAPGDPTNPQRGEYYPLSSEEAAQRLKKQVDTAVSQGAVLEAGGNRVDRPGAWLEPTILTGITPEMDAYKEELFGPVMMVYKVDSEEEALALANDTDFGLGASVYSTDEEQARAFAEKIQAGMVAINASNPSGAELPFGGIKRSGFGRELGPLGMDEFVNKRLYYVKDTDAK
ncbi:NAD-dependent succinate-semialdehyde dehydrogenase [Micrococcoides hystricis]|uniref:NAD-dependent succinate-semialdehyde dehydrogenase n=1 Tax=Micrococcoides hystricis TaxID=1572761 RepID=A0ABV6PCR4_9MICC